MMFQEAKKMLKPCLRFYLLGFLLILALKSASRSLGADELKWMLTPTAWWVSILSGIPFYYAPQAGYVNHSFAFLIAPSCCGISFLIICIATQLSAYLHRMTSLRRRWIWFLWSVFFSYLYTIFINGFRILISIYLPLRLCRTEFFHRFLSPETLHTAIGTIVYFSSLLCLYALSGLLSRRLSGSAAKTIGRSRNWGPPIFCYFAVVLGLPSLSRLVRRDWEGFAEYALLVTSVCLIVLFILRLTALLEARIRT